MNKRTTVLLSQTQEILNQMGELIRLARLRRHLSAELVAERAGISRMTLSMTKLGKVDGASADDGTSTMASPRKKQRRLLMRYPQS